MTNEGAPSTLEQELANFAETLAICKPRILGSINKLDHVSYKQQNPDYNLHSRMTAVFDFLDNPNNYADYAQQFQLQLPELGQLLIDLSDDYVNPCINANSNGQVTTVREKLPELIEKITEIEGFITTIRQTRDQAVAMYHNPTP